MNLIEAKFKQAKIQKINPFVYHDFYALLI